MVKNLPAKAGDVGMILGQEDPLEEGMAIHSSIPAWRTPGTEEPGGLQSMESQRVRHDSMHHIAILRIIQVSDAYFFHVMCQTICQAL